MHHHCQNYLTDLIEVNPNHQNFAKCATPFPSFTENSPSMQGFPSYEFPYELPVFETRYDMSSLDPNEVSASQFQGLILGH